MKSNGFRVTRRNLLIAGGASIAVVAAGASAHFAWRVRRYPGLLGERVAQMIDAYRYPFSSYAQALRSHFHYLDFDDELVDTFVESYTRTHGPKRWNRKLTPCYNAFLLSTDFFQNGADESRPLRYVALYTPGVTICYNPLARLG